MYKKLYLVFSRENACFKTKLSPTFDILGSDKFRMRIKFEMDADANKFTSLVPVLKFFPWSGFVSGEN